MKIGILGTGVVGQTIGSALLRRGHEVRLGSRSRENPKAAEWVREAAGRASHGTFAEAAEFGDVVFNCTAGTGSIPAMLAAGPDNFRDKLVIDVANPLDFTRGLPPTLTIVNDDSLGERIQAAFPAAKVVKTLNTINVNLMVDPALIPGEHHIFVSGNDAEAKVRTIRLLGEWFGWRHEQIIDLGDITTARGTEMALALWIRLMLTLGTPTFNYRIVRGG